jgi:hypothetical protein
VKRSSLDKLISSTGVVIVIVLLCASGALFFAHGFIHTQVHNQLAEEKVLFPSAGTAALTSLPTADQKYVAKYAGQQLLTGAQAEVFADHYIAVHLKEIGGGETYSELSAASIAAPSNQALAAKVQLVFRGETLRGMLLNAYAFDTMALVAYYAAFGALAAGILLVILAGLGFHHAGAVSQTKKRR